MGKSEDDAIRTIDLDVLKNAMDYAKKINWTN